MKAANARPSLAADESVISSSGKTVCLLKKLQGFMDGLLGERVFQLPASQMMTHANRYCSKTLLTYEE